MTTAGAPGDARGLAESLRIERELRTARWPLDEIVERIGRGRQVAIGGAHGAHAGYLLAALAARLGRPLCVVTPTLREARTLLDTWHTFGPTREGAATLLLAAPDVSPWSGSQPDRASLQERLHGIAAARRMRAGDLLVLPVTAWARRVVPPEVSDAHALTIRPEEELDVGAMRCALIESGWTHESLVEDPGTFSVRGSVIDLYAGGGRRPVRIELYGDLVEKMRRFDPATQRSGASEKEYICEPVREEILTNLTLARARDRLRALGDELRIPTTKLSAVLAELQTGVRFFGIESLLPAFHAALVPFWSTLPDDVAVVAVEPELAAAELERFLSARRGEREREVSDGELAFAVEEFFLTEAEVAESLREGRVVAALRAEAAVFEEDAGVGAASADAGDAPLLFRAVGNEDVMRLRKQGASEGGLKALAALIDSWRELYGRAQIVCGTPAAARRVRELIEHQGLVVEGSPAALEPGKAFPPPFADVEVTVGELQEGFRLPSLGIALVSEKEIFGRSARRGSREMAQEATALASFRELVQGDLVVHMDFGVGRYQGLLRMDVGGIPGDFLAIEYADQDRLYLPIYRLSRVQKYVGTAAWSRLDRLGGTTWEKTRERVRRQLADVAQELVQLYAERSARSGHAFSPPDDSYAEFEEGFPYEETPHQAAAIHDVIEDMTSPRPMDRLLCGDVGFGKTEVAIRAAYKAVLDGKQVGVLVPTTVLAEQHLESFRKRLSGTAARVEALSRFRNPAEVRRIVADVGEGRVDILIGTHRILSEDIAFHDLGLLIVDEEQRFGVRQKERIKELKTTVDVLSMTATPIPRTLEMSLLGIRDLSVILTPPPGRLAVRTHLGRFRESVVREAILHEMQRGGEVYFVHNRVETIGNMAQEIRQIVPEARVAVAHAQMGDDELERVMLAFVRREVDVLVCSAIIESGIDIPTANTILIHDADRFGLAQLYQLRGRVGRGQERAYCHLLVRDPKKLAPDAKRRLDVILQHTELGSGVTIAQHDLDIRGAGNLLGRDQSGHIEAVGFELYAELLAEAVAELRGHPAEENWEPEVKIPVAAYIPEDFVADVGQRLLLYKRLSLAPGEAELGTILDEVVERYGPLPETVEALRDVLRLKLEMKRIGAKQIEAGPKAVVVELRPDTRLSPDRVISLIERSRGRYEFQSDMKLRRYLKGEESGSILASALRVSREVTECLAS